MSIKLDVAFYLFAYNSVMPLRVCLLKMNKIFNQIKKYWKVNLVTLIVAIVVGVTIFCLFFFLREMTIVAAVDGVAVAGVSLVFLGLLMWVSHLGAFDTFAFGFKQLGSMLFAKDAKRDGSYSDYKENKAEKRSDSSYNFVTMIAAGTLFLLALPVLEIIYHASIAI